MGSFQVEKQVGRVMTGPLSSAQEVCSGRGAHMELGSGVHLGSRTSYPAG